ncbi:SurA N-terminal domain-containing protein [Candidatus Gottesmanbacteria bacterium]|nr:SurA N-terminal domain-containing protein [Candidatus Gottesmanbacteria bacterium]
MPTKKSTRSPRKTLAEVPATDTMILPATEPSKSLFKNPKLLYLVVALLALSALVLANKGMLVAAVVNGRPIFRWELTRVLTDRYGKQTLEGMVSEALIASEAKKQAVSVPSSEVRMREDEIVKGLGSGMSLDEILKIQGLSKDEFDRQITMQLTVQKLLGKDLTITDADVDGYIATNRATLAATQEAALRAEARQAILDAHIGGKLQPWFLELKQKAKILRFL